MLITFIIPSSLSICLSLRLDVKISTCNLLLNIVGSSSVLSAGLWHVPTNTSIRDNEKENSDQTYRGLQLLTREQAIRITLLETQLREERIQHELLVERLQIQVSSSALLRMHMYLLNRHTCLYVLILCIDTYHTHYHLNILCIAPRGDEIDCKII